MRCCCRTFPLPQPTFGRPPSHARRHLSRPPAGYRAALVRLGGCAVRCAEQSGRRLPPVLAGGHAMTWLGFRRSPTHTEVLEQAVEHVHWGALEPASPLAKQVLSSPGERFLLGPSRTIHVGRTVNSARALCLPYNQGACGVGRAQGLGATPPRARGESSRLPSRPARTCPHAPRTVPTSPAGTGVCALSSREVPACTSELFPPEHHLCGGHALCH